MTMIFIKPSGQEVEVNATSHNYALSLGWKLKDEKPKKEPKPEKAKE
jgi:hypothetical protein